MRKNKKAKTETSVSEKAAKLFSVPRSVMPNVAFIQLAGNRECVVEGCKGIMEYETNIIKINAGENIVTFRGDNLTLRALNDNGAVVEGTITSLEFSS